MYGAFLWESTKGQELYVFFWKDNLPLSDTVFLFIKGKESSLGPSKSFKL